MTQTHLHITDQRGNMVLAQTFNESFTAIFERISPFHLHIDGNRIEPCISAWMTFEEYDRHVRNDVTCTLEYQIVNTKGCSSSM